MATTLKAVSRSEALATMSPNQPPWRQSPKIIHSLATKNLQEYPFISFDTRGQIEWSSIRTHLPSPKNEREKQRLGRLNPLIIPPENLREGSKSDRKARGFSEMSRSDAVFFDKLEPDFCHRLQEGVL